MAAGKIDFEVVFISCPYFTYEKTPIRFEYDISPALESEDGVAVVVGEIAEYLKTTKVFKDKLAEAELAAEARKKEQEVLARIKTFRAKQEGGICRRATNHSEAIEWTNVLYDILDSADPSNEFHFTAGKISGKINGSDFSMQFPLIAKE